MVPDLPLLSEYWPLVLVLIVGALVVGKVLNLFIKTVVSLAVIVGAIALLRLF